MIYNNSSKKIGYVHVSRLSPKVLSFGMSQKLFVTDCPRKCKTFGGLQSSQITKSTKFWWQISSWPSEVSNNDTQTKYKTKQQEA